MTEQYIEFWNNTKKHISNTIDNVEVKQEKYKEDIKVLEKKICDLREEIPYADREDKIYMRQELNTLRDNYAVLCRDGDEKDTELFIKSPYFCKVTTGDGNLFISKYKKDYENDIVLFTDNIAKLRFYDIGEYENINGIKHNVKEKVDYIIEESELKKLTYYKKELTYTYDGEDVTVIKGEMPKVKKVIKPVGDRKIGMQEIIDRMKLEQDTVMRSPEIGVTLINGGAGTGKTNIAIHRLRYLLNEFGGMFKEENMALVCFNVALKEYLSSVIGDLNLKNIKVFSFDKWAYNLVRNYSNIGFINYNAKISDETIEAYKSVEFGDILFNYVQSLSNEIEKQITSNDILKFYIPDQYLFNDIITIEDIFQLRDDIHDIVSAMDNSEERKSTIDRELEKILKSTYVSKIDFNNKSYMLNATNIIYKIYISEELKESYKDAFFYYKPLFQNRANKYELYLITYLLTLISGEINDDLRVFDHIAVDEVQDFLPIQLKALKNISTYSMTLAGDVNQKIFNTNIDEWDGLGITIDNFFTLKEVHRSTIQTINFANALIGKEDEIINDNSGSKPILYCGKGLKDNIENIKEKITNIKSKNKDASIVILYPDSKHLKYIDEQLNESGINSYIAVKDEWDFTKDVSVTNYHQVKGLEFDYVFILGLNEFESYSYTNKEKILYTLLTRSREGVYMYCNKEVPEIIDKVDNSFYDLIQL
ncbi:UvrD-helicase domain-containing protein [Clostridium bornimense]|uniref:UvrD-helicase domain-containing protein n=1 Tax=Clostridium bornimense TaxID=1216932 RepID=UPI001C123556|nr:UvrD-helicase domain-containing protein [Clostridium bornimense]MBU5316520.1 UvrD-helicase domain-containing protein [Clostridium bornimense]